MRFLLFNIVVGVALAYLLVIDRQDRAVIDPGTIESPTASVSGLPSDPLPSAGPPASSPLPPEPAQIAPALTAPARLVPARLVPDIRAVPDLETPPPDDAGPTVSAPAATGRPSSDQALAVRATEPHTAEHDLSTLRAGAGRAEANVAPARTAMPARSRTTTPLSAAARGRDLRALARDMESRFLTGLR